MKRTILSLHRSIAMSRHKNWTAICAIKNPMLQALISSLEAHDLNAQLLMCAFPEYFDAIQPLPPVLWSHILQCAREAEPRETLSWCLQWLTKNLNFEKEFSIPLTHLNYHRGKEHEPTVPGEFREAVILMPGREVFWHAKKWIVVMDEKDYWKSSCVREAWLVLAPAERIIMDC